MSKAWALAEVDWLGIEDGFRSFLRSEDCLELGQLVASLS